MHWSAGKNIPSCKRFQKCFFFVVQLLNHIGNESLIQELFSKMVIQGESQESTFYCLINLVQDVSEPFFVSYSTGCISFSASHKPPSIYHKTPA